MFVHPAKVQTKFHESLEPFLFMGQGVVETVLVAGACTHAA